MRWGIRVLIGLIVFSSFSLAALQYLTKVLVTETAFESPGTNWNAGDDDSIEVSLGFDFPFNGTTYNSVWINSNGMLSFSSSNTAYSNTDLPYNQEEQSIYPYWDDLNRNNGGTIHYETLGNDSNKHFVVSWDGVPHYSSYGDYSFQIVLYEDGGIRFRYKSGSNADGTNCEGNAGCSEVGGTRAGATIGVQEDTSHYDVHSYDTQINQGQDVLYIPPPIDVTLPASTCNKKSQITLTTYDTSGYGDNYPDNASEYQTWIADNAVSTKLFGKGLIDNIEVASSRNNNPYQTDPDEYYLAIFKGYLYFPDTGIYKFGIDGDDAVEVYIDDTLITGWYGGHGRANHATHVKYVNASSGYHKVEFHMQEKQGGDSYYLYWQTSTENSIAIIPPLRYFHCIPRIQKNSCVINDPVNHTNNPKRIPGATIRYAITVENNMDDMIENVIVEDIVNSSLDSTSIRNLQIQNGVCNCIGVSSASNNGANGTGNGTNPVKLDYGTVAANSTECGYFEVDIQ